MKRIICLLLCLALAFACTTGFAAHYDTLSEKLSRQLEKGSGLKGVLTLTAEGEAEWAKLLAPLSGVQLTLRGIAADGRFEYTMYEGAEDGDQKGLTQVYGDEKQVYLRSELLIDTLLTLPLHGDVVSSLTGIGSGNPTFYSALSAIAGVKAGDWAAAWEPVLAPYYEHIDRWMTPYASEPQVRRVGVVSQLEIRYDLPAEAVKAEIKTLLHKALADEALLALVRAEMTDEQAAAYLNPALTWYYDALIDAMPIDADVQLAHCLSAQGERISTSMVFPLAGVEGWRMLALEEHGEDEGITAILTGDDQTMTFTYENAGADVIVGSVVLAPASGEKLGCSFSLEKNVDTYSDEETRTHEVTDWVLVMEPVEEAAAFEPATVQLRLHYYSKPADTQATTLEVALAAELPGGVLNFAGRFRSSSPWALTDDLPTEGAKDLSVMTAKEREDILADLFANALIVLGMQENGEVEAVQETAEEAPEASATGTDLKALTPVATVTDIAPEADAATPGDLPLPEESP